MQRGRHTIYAIANNRRRIYMHGLILPKCKDLTIDHINGDGLDNRRENLRYATRAQQRANSISQKWPKGVAAFRKHWRSCLGRGGCYARMQFRSKIIAAMFYDDKAKERYGEFVRPNFPVTVAIGEAMRLIEKTNGQIFSCVFSKRTDGTERMITCRTGVGPESGGSGPPGGGLAFEPAEKRLLGVWDVQKRNYRFISTERILCLRINKTRYLVNHSDPILN